MPTQIVQILISLLLKNPAAGAAILSQLADLLKAHPELLEQLLRHFLETPAPEVATK